MASIMQGCPDCSLLPGQPTSKKNNDFDFIYYKLADACFIS